MIPFTRSGARLAAVASATLWLATLAAQEALPRSSRAVFGLAAPGIDRGVRGNDPPRPAHSSGNLARGGAVQYLTGSLIVKFRAGTSPAAEQAMLASVDGTGTPDLAYADFDIIALDPASDPEAVARRLDAQPDVEYAQARYRVRPRFVPNDPFY